ncbi:MAG: anti-sigma factor [Candidatus Dadabacteria bacterium]|nr:anti-sigma factor [Candidatus Dadabacteria bacterium]NIS08484.1 anti-sigma factor [Candidatus Dadabacteria bacterium]NIY21972.1 hypothetical protein [Candidatus Dadabacteria bacterium]
MPDTKPTKDKISELLLFLQYNNKKVFSTMLRAFIIAALILSVITSISLWNKVKRMESDNIKAKAIINGQKEQISSLENQIYKGQQLISNLDEIILEQQDILEFLQTTTLSTISLKNYQNKFVVQGKIFFDKPNKKAVLIAKGLDVLPQGYVYQLWAVFKINPTSIGTFNSDGSGDALMKIEYIPNPNKIKRFIITKELGTGSAEPTGDVYLLGSL